MESQFLFGTKALFNKINHLHSRSLSGNFAQILNAMTVYGFGRGAREMHQLWFQVFSSGESLLL